jgi:S-adenosylmethionine decarboxylase
MPRRIAPDIVRQRLLIEGYYRIEVDEAAIRRYFAGLAEALELRAYGEPIVFSPAGLGKAENQGYDAFMPLIDSGVALYVWTGPRFVSAVIYTCKAFDERTAIEFMKSFFRADELATHAF